MKSSMNQNICWLASYPKSGNTWFRIFLSNLLNKSNHNIDINNLFPSTLASSRLIFDDISGIYSSDLTLNEIDKFRPEIYRHESMESNKTIFHKIHDAFVFLPDGKPLIPFNVTKAVLYIIRNPLDIAVSFANHLATDIDNAIKIMNNRKFALCHYEDRLNNQVRQRLLSWSLHVKSWVDQSKLPIHVVRYEDMYEDSFKTFKQATSFIGMDASNEDILSAIQKSTFEIFNMQENEQGFRIKNTSSKKFFRKGVPKDWKNHLSEKQIKQIVKHHQNIMERFGYFPII
jgi:hypothetical protein